MVREFHEGAEAVTLARCSSYLPGPKSGMSDRATVDSKAAGAHDLANANLAIREARRAVRELGAVAVIGNPNPVNGRHIHDPEFEPLWSAIEELEVPVGFHPTGQASLRDDIARR